MEEQIQGVAVSDQFPRTKTPHIKKRALKNKALSIDFNDKDLRDFVSGFHKRKKKRRKEAERNLQEKKRLKRIEARKQRKLERNFVLYGGAQPASGSGHDESGDDHEQEEETGPTAPVSGTKMYDHGNMTIMVTTSEISREEDEDLRGKTQLIPRSSIDSEKKINVPVHKKTFKQVSKHKSVRRPQKKRDKKKGKKKNKKMH